MSTALVEPKAELTEKQRAIFNWMVEHVGIHFYQPTCREIGAHFDIKSPNGVMAHLRALQKKGLIRTSKSESGSASGHRGRAIEFLRREPI